jgi:tetratricopeptide (TPR) repeat protein
LLDDYREYARYHRRHSEISRRIGEVEASRGMLIEALHHLRHADGLVANDARTEHAIGVIQLLRMELTEAEAHFRSATEHQPEGRFAWLMLAQLAEAAGRKEEARAAFGRFLELERDAHWAGLARKRLEALGG